MHSLYKVLLTQHGRQLMPVRCAYSTIAQLHRYFEDVVLENNLNALVVESLPLASRRTSREKARIRELAQSERQAYFFVHQSDSLNEMSNRRAALLGAPVIFPQTDGAHLNEHFIVIADAQFSALLTTVRGRTSDGRMSEDEVIWTFEPDIVYSALEYLMARMGAEHPYHAQRFDEAVRTSMPKATSLQLTVSVTTKLAQLLQEQAAREIAVNRIATAIRESLELGVILQKTVDEVGAALNLASCALRVEGSNSDETLTYFYFKDPLERSIRQTEKLRLDLERHCRHFFDDHHEELVLDGDDEGLAESQQYPTAVVPLVSKQGLMGALRATSVDPDRLWKESEMLLLRTVADQVAVAVNHAALFAQIQQQALTDALTGCYNRRSFEMQLEKDLLMAKRLHQPLSLIMLDVDRFKNLNDSAGHDAGDIALRQLADCFRQVLRGADSAARFGGDEFVLILPLAPAEGALIVAERLRARIQQIEIPGYGGLTASIGIASFPAHAGTRTELFHAADGALYAAKRAGRNCVRVAPDSPQDIEVDDAAVTANHDLLPEVPGEIVM